jgi:uncharacterized protein
MKILKYLFKSSSLFLVLMLSCGEGKKPILGDTEWQKQQNAFFKDASTSPLTEQDLKSFNGLKFFEVDSTFVVTANFILTENDTIFKLKTTHKDTQDYLKYALVKFEINQKSFELEVYRNVEMMHQKGYENNLFLPFTDPTNGEETYGGGRYLNLTIPDGDSIIIDFNKAYNPYCAYNENYACPIVPRQNRLNIKVLAGEKNFNKQ